MTTHRFMREQERQRREAAREPAVGDTIICKMEYAVVQRVIDHPPWTHPDSTVYAVLPAREWVTSRGSRWAGLDAAGDAINPPAVVKAQ